MIAAATALDRVLEAPELPANLQAEASVLGAIMVDSNLLPYCLAEGLSVEEFSTSVHRELFAIVLTLLEKDLPIDFVTVGEAMAHADYAVLADLCNAVVELRHVLHHVSILKKKSRLRMLIKLGSRLVEECRAPGACPYRLTESVREQLGQ
jgi:replicative DNA helicase